jgi:hypothetical protein
MDETKSVWIVVAILLSLLLGLVTFIIAPNLSLGNPSYWEDIKSFFWEYRVIFGVVIVLGVIAGLSFISPLVGGIGGFASVALITMYGIFPSWMAFILILLSIVLVVWTVKRIW